MKEDFVPYELAKKLKEKGYPQHIADDAYIVDNDGEDEYNIGERLPIPLIPDYMDVVSAPTISQVLKWLREEKKIHIHIEYIFTETCEYDCEVQIINSYERFYPYGDFDTYEESALTGIEYALDNLL